MRGAADGALLPSPNVAACAARGAVPQATPVSLPARDAHAQPLRPGRAPGLQPGPKARAHPPRRSQPRRAARIG